ncbi:MAG: ankyrin repeat domain-containing protein, partial [Planctomycetota bacterium]
AKVEARDNNGSTPLIFAAGFSSSPEIVKLLLDKGAKVEARNNNGSTPLMHAAYNSSKSTEIIQLLKAAGAKE